MIDDWTWTPPERIWLFKAEEDDHEYGDDWIGHATPAMEGGEKDWRKLYLRATPERLAAEELADAAALVEATLVAMFEERGDAMPLILAKRREELRAVLAKAGRAE